MKKLLDKYFDDHGALCSSKIDALMSSKGFTFLGEGRHRRTYLSPNKRYVLKFPRWSAFVSINQKEHKLWHHNKLGHPVSNVKFAPCRLIDGVVLMMQAVSKVYGNSRGCNQAGEQRLLEQINPKLPDNGMPDWANSVDCWQVGFLKSGKIVAYDYGE